MYTSMISQEKIDFIPLGFPGISFLSITFCLYNKVGLMIN